MDATLAQLLNAIYDLTEQVRGLTARVQALDAANADLEMELVSWRTKVGTDGRLSK